LDIESVEAKMTPKLRLRKLVYRPNDGVIYITSIDGIRRLGLEIMRN